MGKQSNEDQAGGAQATGRMAKSPTHGQADAFGQTDNFTGKGTQKVPFVRDRSRQKG